MRISYGVLDDCKRYVILKFGDSSSYGVGDLSVHTDKQ